MAVDVLENKLGCVRGLRPSGCHCESGNHSSVPPYLSIVWMDYRGSLCQRKCSDSMRGKGGVFCAGLTFRCRGLVEGLMCGLTTVCEVFRGDHLTISVTRAAQITTAGVDLTHSAGCEDCHGGSASGKMQLCRVRITSNGRHAPQWPAGFNALHAITVSGYRVLVSHQVFHHVDRNLVSRLFPPAPCCRGTRRETDALSRLRQCLCHSSDRIGCGRSASAE